MNNDELGLFLKDDRTAYKPGDTLELSVLWALQKTPSSIEVRLFWYTRGKGTEDVEIVATTPLAPAAAGETKLNFVLPEAPYSFSGRLVSLSWAVELVVEPGSRSTRCDITMSPTGGEVLLIMNPPS
ncbi:MAG: hypothetical protein QM790_15540 [Nibricoccus sp.]